MDVFLFLAFYDDENAQTSENMVGQDMVVVWHPKYVLLFVSFQLLMDVFMFLAFYDNEIVWTSEIAAGQDMVVVWHWHPKYILFLHFFLFLFNY